MIGPEYGIEDIDKISSDIVLGADTEKPGKISIFLDNIKSGLHQLRYPRKKFPDYDPELHGPLVEFEIPVGFEEVERYWVNEPYSFISILVKGNVYLYHVAEPMLTLYEKDILERVYDDLQDILSVGGVNSTRDKETVLMEQALSLFNRYHAHLELASAFRIIYYLKRNFLGHDRINSLMLDPYIEDISCDGISVPIFMYHNKYRNIKTNVSFSEEEINSLVIKLCQKGGKHISVSEPMVDATLPDGSRLQATLGKEITTRGSSFTIRKFRGDPITPIDLINYKTCNIEMMAYFWLAIENGDCAIFAGGTASGKTSLLNAVSLFIPPLSKVVSIEDTREVTLHHDNWIAGVTRKPLNINSAGEVSMYDLLRSALRQRPEYILVGEIRGEEALTLFQAISTGHATYSTMHAGDVQTVVNRLDSPPLNVPHVMLQSLDILSVQIQTFVNNKRVRRTQSLVEFTGIDTKTGYIRINELYRWDPLTDTFIRNGDSYTLNKVMTSRGWDRKKLSEELDRRERILKYLCEKEMRDYVRISLVVQAYDANPENVLDAIENDTLDELIEQSV
ncbi:type II/IV secretion system ATPase subunit [Methanolobus mangrovi]|uniref:Type II/IV secretion system ATPase subunit n=1 Tax=Methanolobus mangrovi TaxID=3072977 RepID=A0AA51UG73_9EURY|nr:type II/IV secretion system ATPase subunit [Methanolobus mangrovi]WMW22596.1 type II/IV secretion system ATPase subunit [Methanolobus mangrovi]